MNNSKNVIVMFLFVMLSFAIISEVSAADDAETNLTEFDQSLEINNSDIVSESHDDCQIQDYDNIVDDAESSNEQISFDDSSDFEEEDNQSNENLYEHEVDEVSPLNENSNQNEILSYKPIDKPYNFSNSGLMGNGLKDNEFMAPPNDDGDVVDNVVQDLIGLKNITPNFKKGDNNSDLKKDDSKLKSDKKNTPKPVKSVNKKLSKKSPKVKKKLKNHKKSNKLTPKKIKMSKKPKKGKKDKSTHPLKNLKRERIKL